MKTTTLYIRRFAVVAALLGAVFSPASASAQSMLDTSEATAFLGNWNIALEAEFGGFDVGLEIEDQGGKVSASVTSGEGGTQSVTDITRSGENVVLSYEMDYQGQLLPVSVTLTPGPDGEGFTADFDFGGQLSASGAATPADG
jgi:hypothetical protein